MKRAREVIIALLIFAAACCMFSWAAAWVVGE